MVCEVHVVTLLDQTLVFERCIERLVVHNRHQNNICQNLINPCAHNTYIYIPFLVK